MCILIKKLCYTVGNKEFKINKRISKNFVTIVLAALLFFPLASCESPDKKNMTIISADWSLVNIDPSFFTSPTAGSAFISISIHYAESNIIPEDISSINITYPAGNASIEITGDDIADMFDPNANILTTIMMRSSVYSDNYSSVALGQYTIQIELNHDTSNQFVLDVTVPGSTISVTNSLIKTESFIEGQSSSYTYYDMPLRAGIIGAVKDDPLTAITLTFSVNDSKIYNGYVLLYNSTGTKIGTSYGFRYADTFGVTTFVNGATDAFYNDGTINTVVLDSGSISSFLTGYSLADVDYVHVLLTDGEQYSAGTVLDYDARSISAKAQVTP